MDRLEHRKGKAVLHFQDREGKPLAGKAEEVRQKNRNCYWAATPLIR